MKKTKEVIIRERCNGFCNDGITALLKGALILMFVVVLFCATIRVVENKIMFKENAYQQCTQACTVSSGWHNELTNMNNGQCVESCNRMLLELTSRGGK